VGNRLSAASPPALRIRALAKTFSGQRALAGVDLEVGAGEIHALLGENGAGKSTLIKILARVEKPDSGVIEAEAGGLHFVHQDLGLVDSLSVAENIALGRGYARRLGLIDHRATERSVAELLSLTGANVAPSALVGDLAQAEKVLVALARAFSADARLIVLDEVTASLPTPEVERLFDALRRARDRGTSFIFVTHRIDEVFEIADRVTVLRDGRRVATAPIAELTRDKLVELIVGRSVDLLERHAPMPADDDAARLRVRGAMGEGLATPASFDVRAGEVVALTGLIGCGASALARMIVGAEKRWSGDVLVDGVALRPGRPAGAARAGCLYVAGDRHREGIAPDLSIRENLFLSNLGARAGRALRSPRGEASVAHSLIERFGIRPSDDPERLLATLSGGNQQKVVVGRALRREPRVLVLHDPTVGVDVGARVELHRLTREAAARGAAVLLVSSDFAEVATEASRALVMRDGAIACELKGPELTAARLAAESYRAGEEEAA
jgi:ribose transport system ATP-binding protein